MFRRSKELQPRLEIGSKKLGKGSRREERGIDPVGIVPFSNLGCNVSKSVIFGAISKRQKRFKNYYGITVNMVYVLA